ncbi:MAG: GAF domain-containing protein [Desulfamplus sp.]|nr:GAF domain-containing protein [Desulfamplus sp.]
MIYIDLILNLSLLVSLSIVSGFIERHYKTVNVAPTLALTLQGLLFGGAAVLGMMRPLNLGPGLIFDGRSVMVSLCTLFFGPLSGVIAAIMPSAYRMYIGGAGAVTGVLVVFSSFTIGIVTRFYFKPESKPPLFWHLYLFGFIVHVAMLAMMFTLPKGAGMSVVARIGLPVMLLYPLATILAGKILSDQIQSRKQMNELEQSKALLTSLINSIHDIVFFKDINGVYLGCNKAFTDHLGIPVESIVGKTDYDLYTKEDAEFFRENDKKMLDLMAPRHSEECISYPDGQKKVIDTIKTPYFDSTGKLIGIIGVSRDINEIRRAEKEHELNESRLRKLVDILKYPANTTQEFLDYALEKTIELTKSKIGYIYHYHEDRKEFVLNTWSKNVMPECKVLEPQSCYTLEKTGIWGEAVRQSKAIILNDFKADNPLKKGYPEGHVNLIKFMTVPIFRGDKIVGVIGLANKELDYDETDILQVSLLMDGIWELNENRRIEKENRQIGSEKDKLHKQLIQAQKMESVGRLAGGVAHDFNNMLGVILGNIELAMEDIDTDHPVFATLQEIRKAAERSVELTRQLLAFARKQNIAPEVLDINQAVESMIKIVQRLIGEDIDLVWSPCENIWTVNIDPSQIDQIIVNLCVNARDAIADVGKITIETGIQIFDNAYCDKHYGFLPGEYVILAISDNGCGMDKITIENIFEPFFTTKEMGKGTGLGLAMVYGIVKQNGGFINVYSELNQGTTFKIYFPRYKKGGDILEHKNLNQSVENGSETILLVEDEYSILQLTKILLEKQGYKVLAASTPQQAIDIAKRESEIIELLVTDVVMPTMNGRELAKNILTIYPDIKVLFMSGYTANVIAHHGVLDPGVNFLQKPFSKDELANSVRYALTKDSTWKE